MTEKESSESSGFKVVDKRRFDEAGLERAEDTSSSAVKTPEVSKNADEKKAETPPKNEQPAQRPPITFSIFIQSLAHQTLMAMGLVPWPDSGLVKKDLDHAKETIDILTMLHEKSAGNLTSEEKRIFDTLLYELRMTFVQVSGAPVEEKKESPIIQP